MRIGPVSKEPSAVNACRRDRRLIDLLAAGMKEVAIARHMGQDPRTVRRHISELLKRLGATTRFQAGLQAAKRGWI